MDFFSFFRKKQQPASGSVAKDRLKLVLVHDRVNCSSQVLEMLGKSDTPIFVAVEGEQVLGYGFCMMEQYRQNTVMNDRVTLYIDDLCVLEECRGQHIGTAIYNAILEYAKFRGCYNVTLNVWTCNESAMKFYESLGMKPQKIGMEAIL